MTGPRRSMSKGVSPVVMEIERSGLDRLTTRLLWLLILIAFLHHADHALRVDHSGWPFREMVTPFTYSLAAYPVILFALFGPLRLFWMRWVLLAAATAFTIFAHTAIENPMTQFHMWAHNASAHDEGLRNALDVRSPLLGVLSMTIGMALNITAIVATLATARCGLQKPSRSR